MKLHISLGQPPLAGYTNIDISKQPMDFSNLDSVCDAAECTDLIVNDVLRFVFYEQLPVVIQHLAGRLRHKSKMTIIFTDINNLIRAYNRRELDEKQFNQLIFSQGSRSCFSHHYILTILKAVRLNIISVDISKEQVVIVTERP